MINDPVQYKKACEEMRYFDIGGLQCRALPFDNQLLGSNKEKLANNNVFYKAPKGEKLEYKSLEEKFQKYGEIKSLKISINPDHSQRGFAYICYENAESATAAATAGDAIIFEAKDNRQIVGKLINNLYFKNIPTEMKEEQVKEIF